MCCLYGKFASYLRRFLCKTRLIFPRINGPIDTVFQNSTPEKIVNSWRNEQNGISAIKLEAARLLKGVFVAVTVVVRTQRQLESFFRRLGTTIQSNFLCPIRSQHSLDRLEMIRWESVPRHPKKNPGAVSSRVGIKGETKVFARTCKLLSRLFRPAWLPLGLRGRYPGALPPMLENVRRAFSPGPTDCLWVSEDAANSSLVLLVCVQSLRLCYCCLGTDYP